MSRYFVIPQARRADRPFLCDTLYAKREAEVVVQLIERWGMVAGISDGEDSSGRQKLRLATPEELVDRAMSIAELAFDRMKQKGYLIDGPPPEKWDEIDDLANQEKFWVEND